MAQQIRTISSSAGLQTWTPTGAAGAAILAVDDGNYVESDATSNTASGTLALASSFTLPDDAEIHSVVVRAKVRLAAAGARTVRCGFNGTAMADTQSLTSTGWVYMDFPFALNPATTAAWTAAGVNALTTAYLRAYADADGPVVQADYLAIVVDFTSTEEPDPEPEDPISIPGIAAIYSGSTPIAKVLVGETMIWPAPTAEVMMTVTGTSFAPKVELRGGSSATIDWQSSGATVGGTSTAPTITWGDAGPHAVLLSVSRRDDLTTINFGFDAANDAGRYGPGAGYNHAAQAVTAVSGLRNLTGLKRFLAAGGPLTGTLDMTGCSSLEFIECFEADVESVVLDGCSSLIRLCVESCKLSLVDLNPVRTTLRDLRAANQQGGLLEFVPLAGSLTSLYHFCVRTQELVNMPGLDLLPIIEQWWVWGCGIVIPGTPVSTVLNSCLADNNQIGQAAVDQLLLWIRDHVPAANGNVDLSGTNAAPSAIGESAAASIIARGGWSVSTSSISGGEEPEEPEGFTATTVTAALQQRWIFAHQSVGYQVIQGTQAWCDTFSLPDPLIVDVVSGTIPGSGGYLGHWYVGTNGDGFSKITDFDTRIRGGLHAQADVFVLKFCYADLRPNSGYTPAQLFAQYEIVMDGLMASYPAKTFIAATETIVMETDEDGPNNGLRMTFNNLVRAKYGSGHLWDIALALSTDPDGNRIRTGSDPNWVEHLYSAYASADQEHISGAASIGRKAAAAPLLQILAAL